MKHIVCKECGRLYKPAEREQHKQECNIKETNDSVHPDEPVISPCTTKQQNTVNENKNFQQNFNCSKCGKEFALKFTLKRHEEKCDGPSEKKTSINVCPKCRKTFSSYRTRLRHEKTCSNNGRLHKPAEHERHKQECNNKESNASVHPDEPVISPCTTKQQNTVNEKKKKNFQQNFNCSKCGKEIALKCSLKRHEEKCDGPSQKKTSITVCPKCRKTFSSYRTRLRHEKTCKNNTQNNSRTFNCIDCNEIFSTSKELTKHELQCNHNKPSSSSKASNNKTLIDSPIIRTLNQPKCRMCGDRFSSYRDLYHHRMFVHKQSGGGNLQDYPWIDNEESPPWMNDDGSENESMRREYDLHRHLILRERVQEGDVRNTYNFPVPNLLNVEQLMEQIEFIFEHSQNAFKVNLSFGLILRNIENETYRYFVPYYTDGLFLFPQLINNRNDIEKLHRRFSELDLSNYFQKQKPNSKWRPVVITNVLYHIHKTSFPLGLSQPLPDYIVKSKSIISFEKNPNTKRLYDDDRCFFRCIAYHRTQNIHCEKLTNELRYMWVKYVSENRYKSTDVTLCRMPDLEKCFETNINVFELSKENTVTNVYKSMKCFPSKSVNLNLFEDHLSYVSKFKTYASKFQCRLCEKLFNSICHLIRHEKTCENASELRFSGGYFSSPKSIFDKLKDLGINVETSLQSYPYFLTFDLEAMLKQTDEQNGDRLTKTSRHEPISVSICSNVNGFTNPKFILDQNLESLLKQMISYMNDISNKSYSLARERWAHVFVALERLEGYWLKTEEGISGADAADAGDTADGDGDVADACTDSDAYDTYDDDDDNDDDDGDVDVKVKETDECEPPSAEFLHAMSKENVSYSFFKRLIDDNEFQVNYNKWQSESESENENTDTEPSDDDGDDNDVDDGDDDDDDDVEVDDVDDDDDDDVDDYDDDICIPKMVKRRRIIDDDDDDDDISLPKLVKRRRINDDDDNDDVDDDNDDDGNDDDGNVDDYDDDDDDVRPPKLLNRRRINDDDDDDDDNDDEKDHDYRTFPVTSKLMSNLIKRTREQFEIYCHQVPTLGYNCAKYDLNLLKSKLAKHMKLQQPNQQKFVVKRNNAYMCLSNKNLRFLDMINYLPPGTSYDKFLDTFGVSQRKSYFPYEYFTNIAVLEERSLPPKEAFYSSLKQCNTLEDKARVTFDRLITKENKTESEALSILKIDTAPRSTIEEKYQSLLQVWKQNNMSTFRDFLEYYNNLDVLPMVEAVEKFRAYFIERDVDVFKDCISVPGAARKMLYKAGFKQGASFSLIDKQDEDMYHTVKSNIVGGPSIIFTRNQEAGQTNIRGNEHFPCKSVLGYDANSLYVHALSQPMPCGNYIRRKKENNFKPFKTSHRYTVMYDWLEWLNHSQNVHIKHKMNTGDEKRIGPYLVDGYDTNTDVVYEFLGCYFHGHSCIKRANPEQQKQRFTRTQERFEYLRSHGYEIVSIWECEFRKQVKQNETMKHFIDQRYPSFYRGHTSYVKESQIIDAVVNESLFGFIEVDIQVPESWDQIKFKPETDLDPALYFQEMCPLFCTTEVNFECIGEHMQQHAKQHGLSTKPRCLLVGGMKAECMLLSSPLLKWYIEHGLLVTHIYQIVEFSKSSCFKDFVDNVTNDRRQGDVDQSQELKSSLSKLVGVSAFGGTIINQEKFQKIKYVEGFKKACFAVNNPRFRQLTELGEDMFEAEFANARISINNPVYLGYMILQYAKLHMLSFYFDFLLKFVGREAFEMSEMDTDAFYFGLAAPTLRDAILPDMLSIFDRNIFAQCRDDFAGDRFKSVWFPRQCCPKHNKYDLRTPGIMKLEFTGTRIIGLCSKSYIAVNDEGQNKTNIKYSLKGVNNQFVDPSESFQHVLNTQNPVIAVNRGIRVFNNTLFTYTQAKQAFSYFYCKRLVQADGIHTKPLDIVLKPINRNKQKQQEKEEDIKQFLYSLSM